MTFASLLASLARTNQKTPHHIIDSFLPPKKCVNIFFYFI